MYDAPVASVAWPAVVPLVVVPLVVPAVDPVVEAAVLDDIAVPRRAFVNMNRSLAVDDELVVPVVVPAVVPDVPAFPGAAFAGCRQPVTVIDF